MTDTVAQRDAGTVRRRRWSWTTAAPHVAFLLLAFILVGAMMHDFEYVSPTDEIAHLDYLQRLPEVPATGDRLSQPSLRERACRGFSPEQPFGFPPCEAPSYDADQFPGRGYSYSGATPPVYYAVTAALTRPVAAVTGVSLFELARWCGALWLAAFMSVAYLVGLRLGASRLAAASAGVLSASSIGFVTSAATIGPDIATAVVGGLIVLSGLAYDGTRRSLLVLVGLAALGAATKQTTFTAVGAVMLLLLLASVPVRGRTAPWRLRRAAGVAAAMFGAFALVSALWGAVYAAQAKVDPDELPINAMFLAEVNPLPEVWQAHVFPFLATTVANWRPAGMDDATNAYVEGLVGGLNLIGLVALAVGWWTAGRDGRSPDRRLGALGIGTFVVALVGPSLLVLLNFYVNGLSFAIVPRYGYGVLAVYCGALALLCRDRGPSRALALLGVVGVLNVLT